MTARLSVLIFLGLFTAEALANNSFIPNYYRNRRAPNNFAAVGWSDRKEVAVSASHSDYENKQDGKRIDHRTGPELGAYGYYRLPSNLNLEGAYGETVRATGKTNTGQIGLGYEFGEIPLAVGLAGIFENSDTNSSDISGGVGYRLDDNLYLGLGFENYAVKDPAGDSDNQYYVLGVGKVFGDRANPDAAAEVNLTVSDEASSGTLYDLTAQGLLNGEFFQLYGGADYAQSSSKYAYAYYGLTVGADYRIAKFYLGPQLEWYKWVDKISSTIRAEEQTVRPSLEAGYRDIKIEGFVRYTLMTTDNDVVTSARNSSKNEGNTLTFQASYRF